MDLSSPGRKAGPVTTLQSDLESAASPITAETHCSVKNGLPGDYSDKSLQGIHRHGQGHDIANVVRLRLECITDGQMKVMLSNHYTAADCYGMQNPAQLPSIAPPERGEMPGH